MHKNIPVTANLPDVIFAELSHESGTDHATRRIIPGRPQNEHIARGGCAPIMQDSPLVITGSQLYVDVPIFLCCSHPFSNFL
jgi:hypothetical protein